MSKYDQAVAEYEAGQKARVAQREKREAMLAELRLAVKASSYTYKDLARSTSNTPGFIGQQLRGHFPHYGACYVTRKLATALISRGFDVPDDISM